MRKLTPLFVISTAALLTACGGGSSSSPGSPPAGGQSTGPSRPLTGRFVDGPVSGLRYSTPTSNGSTNANGEFIYRDGETVSFFIGDILIGQAPGAATITPFSLAGTAPPTSTLDVVKAVRLINAHRIYLNNTATPLEVAANIASFLQTVDSDGDPSNGIQIPGALNGLAKVSINFRQTFSRFQYDTDVQALIAAGGTAGIWSGSRTLKDPFLALDALYSGLKLTPGIQRITGLANSGGAGTVTSTITRTYDAQGHVTSEDTKDATGKLAARVTTTYDQNGHKLSEQRDNNADGQVDAVTTYIYNSNGVLTRVESSKAVGGPIDSAANFFYDGPTGTTGKLAKIETVDAKGKVLARSEFTYTNGNVTKETDDTNADGTVDNVTTNTYDTSGHLLTSNFDPGANGSAVDSDAYTYDANDNVTTQVHSSKGQVSLNVNYSYDTYGNPTVTQFTHPTAPNTDFTYTYTYNSDGTLKVWTKTVPNGSVAFSVNYNYESTTNWASAGWVQ